MLRVFIVSMSLFVSVALCESAAHAQCTKDSDCKGNRICVAGACENPAPPKVETPSPAASTAQPAVSSTPLDACANIGCSGHGQCVLRGGEPLCACNAGFVPDPTGINCIAAQAAPAHSSPTRQPATPRAASTGWALPAAIIGFVAGSAVFGMAMGSASLTGKSHDEYDYGYWAAAEEHEEESWVLAISAISIAAAAGPVVFAGGRSARRHPGARGSTAFRIIGWATWGTSLGCALAMVGVGLADERVPPALIGFTGGLGATGIFSFAADALISRKDANSAIAAQAVARKPTAPKLIPLITINRQSNLLLGFGGRF